MKFFILLAVVCSAAYALPTVELMAEQWVNFKSTHQKTYKSLDEELYRLNVFQSNLKRIEEHNEKYDAGKSTYKMGVNKFADWTRKEFEAYVNKFNAFKPRKTLEVAEIDTSDVPSSVNWVEEGVVSPVKDQGQCGSCWAFSTTGAIEAAVALNFNETVLLSEQELVDCSWDYGNDGCNGGLMDSAFDYVVENGLGSEEDYPYTAEDGVCKAKEGNNVTTILGHVSVPRGELALKAAVAKGPVAVAIDASWNLQLYDSGVLDDDLCDNSDWSLNHGVLAVGYGAENGVDYWLVKNSWGESFGEKGYFKLSRNNNNQCGISNMASYPVVA